MKAYLKLLFHFSAVAISFSTAAQEIDTVFTKNSMDYPTYIYLVGKNNLAYSAEKFNIDISEAKILNASIFPDPELRFGWYDNGQQRNQLGYGLSSEISWTLELGGKRKARIELAKNEAQISTLLLEDYFRNLRAHATLAYLIANQNRLLLEVQTNSYLQMKKIAESDSIRFRLGAITQIDARQSKLEAGSMLNEIYSAEAEWKKSLTVLSLFLGTQQSDTFLNPHFDFSEKDQNFSILELTEAAINNRMDLRAALKNKNISQSLLKLAKANRVMDLGLSVGMNYASNAYNEIAPSPSFNTVNVGIQIPLKFSNSRPGELRTAQFGIKQAEQQYNQALLEIKIEVANAYYDYTTAQKQVRQFNAGMLLESKAIMDGKIYSYHRGQTGLLEVLNAQRTYNIVQQSYYQTLYNQHAALVELKRVVGTWDIAL